MTLCLLGKSVVSRSEVIVVNDRIVYDRYELIFEMVSRYCPKVIVAEPVVTIDNDTNQLLVSWYADTETEPESCRQENQKQVYDHLVEAIQELYKVFSQGGFERKLIESAFVLKDPSDVLIAGTQVVLKEWGVKTGNMDNRPFSLLTLLANQEKETQKVQSVHESVVLPNQSVQPPPVLDKNSSHHAVYPDLSVHKQPFNVYAVLPRLLAAILFFMIGILLGWRIIFAERPLKIAGVSIQQAQDMILHHSEINKQNHVLQDEISQLERKLKNPPCNIKESRADPSLNKSLEPAYVPATHEGKHFQGSLPELLEQSTVFIMSAGNNSGAVASGTGFFITPDLILTNRHVVENARDNVVMVTNKTLGQLRLAHIVSVSQSSKIGALDLAVLKLENAPPQQPLGFSLEVRPLQDVVAAGYPGILISQDGAMQRLLKGNLQAIPGVILTKGQVNGIQGNVEGEKVIPHSAMVSPGNSGGPLVDMCGRVVGINTFITMDLGTSSHGNYAQKSDGIIQVLQAANIPIQVQAGACQEEKISTNPNEGQQQEKPLSVDKDKPDSASIPTQEKGE